MSTINGTDGVDYLVGDGAGDDTLYGGAGDDSLISRGTGFKYLDGGTGDDSIGVLATGTQALQYYITAGAGDDMIDAIGTGTIRGDAGDDYIRFGSNAPGITSIDGGAGDDIVLLRFGHAAVIGGTGEDGVDYSGGFFLTSVGVGVNLLTGKGSASAEGDTYRQVEDVYGSVVNDTLLGSGVSNLLYGDNGDDLIAGRGGADFLDGGAGIDTADYSASSAAVLVNLLTGDTVYGDAEQDMLFNFENLNGSAFNDTLTGDNGANRLDGLGGNDTLTGGLGNDVYIVDSAGDKVIELAGEGIDEVWASLTWTIASNFADNLTLTGTAAINGTGNALGNVITGNDGNNTLYGMDGNDTLAGGGGTNSLRGGLGNDVYIIASTGDVVVEAADQGYDEVRSSIDYTMNGNSIEVLTLTGSAAINATGNSRDTVFVGNDAANTIDAMAGNDDVYGMGGADILKGGDGNDTLTGGTGADTMSGGKGNDSYQGDNTGDIGIDLNGEGTDTVYSSVTYSLAASFADDLVLGAGTVHGTGNALANAITGGSGYNQLAGGDGNDRLTGNGAADQLTGGLGADRFVYLAATDSVSGARDVITDFSHAQGDKIDLDGLSASPLTFIGNASFTGVAGQVRTYSFGYDFVEVDLDGNGTLDMLIEVQQVPASGAPPLVASDFIL